MNDEIRLQPGGSGGNAGKRPLRGIIARLRCESLDAAASVAEHHDTVDARMRYGKFMSEYLGRRGVFRNCHSAKLIGKGSCCRRPQSHRQLLLAKLNFRAGFACNDNAGFRQSAGRHLHPPGNKGWIVGDFDR